VYGYFWLILLLGVSAVLLIYGCMRIRNSRNPGEETDWVHVVQNLGLVSLGVGTAVGFLLYPSFEIIIQSVAGNMSACRCSELNSNSNSIYSAIVLGAGTGGVFSVRSYRDKLRHLCRQTPLTAE